MHPTEVMDDVEEIRAYYGAVLPYYDPTLEGRGDLPFWDSIARRWGAKRILELGCGTGRVTEVLTRHGSVTGVDLLIEMLQRARKRAPKANLVAADLRRFSFTASFDLVVLADDPLAHLTSNEDRISVMRSIRNHLAPDGRVIFEGLYRPVRQVMLTPARNIFSDGIEPFSVEEVWTPVGEDSTWQATYRYRQDGAITEVTTALRSWKLREVDRLREIGLETEILWGDFDEAPFRSSSPRIVIVARRQADRPAFS